MSGPDQRGPATQPQSLTVAAIAAAAPAGVRT